MRNEQDDARAFAAIVIILGWVVIAAVLHGCGSVDPICVAAEQEYVVGGEASTDRRATSFVRLDGGYCTGTVLGPYTVITAGHCTNADYVRVDGVGIFAVVEDIPHPQYIFPKADLRILHTELRLPAPYAELADYDLVCYGMVVQGYGWGSPGGALYERVVDYEGEGSGLIVTSEGSCNGDSGGPLWALTQHNYVLLGVTSLGYGEPYVCNGKGGYTDVRYYRDWIERQVR